MVIDIVINVCGLMINVMYVLQVKRMPGGSGEGKILWMMEGGLAVDEYIQSNLKYTVKIPHIHNRLIQKKKKHNSVCDCSYRVVVRRVDLKAHS